VATLCYLGQKWGELPGVDGIDSWGGGDGTDSWGGDGDSWGSSVSGVDGRVGDGASVHVLDDGSGHGLLDDVSSTDWDWDGDLIGPLDVDGGWDLDHLLDVLDDVIGHVVGLLHVDGLVDDVLLGPLLDDGGGDAVGALEGGGHSNVDLGDHGLEDLGVVAGHVLLLGVVGLLGDHWGWDGHAGGGWGLGLGGVWGGHADGWGWEGHGGDSGGDGHSGGDGWGGVGAGGMSDGGGGDDASGGEGGHTGGEGTSVPQGIVGDLSGGSDSAGHDSRQDGSHGVHDAKLFFIRR